VRDIARVKRIAGDPKNNRSVRSIITQSRAGYRFYKLLKVANNLAWWVKETPINGKYLPEVGTVPKITPEEGEKLLEAVSIIREVLENNNWNRNTQLIINQIENYDRSK
jgi:hypothetical protein